MRKKLTINGILLTILLSGGTYIAQFTTAEDCVQTATWCSENISNANADEILACKIVERDGCGILRIPQNALKSKNVSLDAKYVSYRNNLFKKRKNNQINIGGTERIDYSNYLQFEIGDGITVNNFTSLEDIENQIKNRDLQVIKKRENNFVNE